jgi:plastocyanin
MMRSRFATIGTLLLGTLCVGPGGPGAAHAQAPAEAAPVRVAVALSNFAFAPGEVRIPAGRPVALVLTNDGSGGHDFAAPEFFAAARVDPADAARLRRGRVEVPKGQTVTLRLVAAPGRYALKCTHFLHAGFGMTGSIIVE